MINIQTRKEIRMGKGHSISELKELEDETWISYDDMINMLKEWEEKTKSVPEQSLTYIAIRSDLEQLKQSPECLVSKEGDK